MVAVQSETSQTAGAGDGARCGTIPTPLVSSNGAACPPAGTVFPSRVRAPVPEAVAAEPSPPQALELFDTVTALTGGGSFFATFAGPDAAEAAELAAPFPPESRLQWVEAVQPSLQIVIVLPAERSVRRLVSALTPRLKRLPDGAGVTISIRWPGGFQVGRLLVKDGELWRER